MSLGLKGNAGVICMPKLDGLSLLYNELTGEAYSRGGIENEGQDCTSHYRASIQCYNPASSFHYTLENLLSTEVIGSSIFMGNVLNSQEIFLNHRVTQLPVF